MRRMYSQNQLETQIKSVIESGQVDNAKPLYFHPIAIGLTGSYYLTMIIINNDATAFTRQTLTALLKADSGRYLVNGNYFVSGDDGYYLSPAYAQHNQGNLYLVGIDSKGSAHTSSVNAINFENMIANSGTFEDAVNKIN